MVKNPLPMQETKETWVHSLGWEDPLEEGTATHSSIVAWRIPCTEETGDAKGHGITKSRTRLSDNHFHFHTVTCSGRLPPYSQLFSGFLSTGIKTELLHPRH